MEFEGKAALVTGAASGIGLLTAQCLAREGAGVAVADVDLAAAERAVQEIENAGGRAIALGVDVRVYDQVAAAVARTVERFGRLDILVNCAGGCAARVFQCGCGFEDMDIKYVDWGVDVNLKGPIYFAHAAIKQMMRQSGGVIVNIGSIDGQTGSPAIEYSAAKSGVMNGLTKSLALTYARHGVRVNCVTPGPVLTRPAMANMKTLLGRAAQPREIVDLILYLCSDRAAFITGANYMIDGGRSAGTIEW